MNRTTEAFDLLIQEFFTVWGRYHPQAGVARLQNLSGDLPPTDDDDAGALVAWLETTMVALEEIRFAELDAERQIDLRILFGACMLEYTTLVERDWRHRDPLAFLEALELLSRSPLKPVAVAEFLRHARGLLGTFPEIIPPIWIEGAKSLGRSLDHGLRHQQIRLDTRSGGEDTATQALGEFLSFLDDTLKPVARGESASGTACFSRYLKHGYLLTGTPADYRAWITPLAEAKVGGLAEPGEGQNRAALKQVLTEGKWFEAIGEEVRLAVDSGEPLLRVAAAMLRPDRGLVRNIFPCRSLTAAWALYLRRLQSLEEPTDQEVLSDFTQHLSGAVLLARVDLEYHCGHLTLDEGVNLIATLNTVEESEARSIMLKVTREPGSHLSTLIYFYLLEQVAEQHFAFEPERSRRFHAALLESGPIPLPLVPVSEPGPVDWSAELERLLARRG